MNIISFLIGIVVLIAILKFISLPFKIIIKFIINSIIAGIILGICSAMGIGITIYWWTVLLIGLLGVPGLAIAVIITILI